MAEFRKRPHKTRSVYGLMKDQTAVSLARATGTSSSLQIAVTKATNHDENLPEEKYVEEILAAGAGSRLNVQFCTQALVKRLTKTQNWAVAIKCLVVLHRTILDGGFLFQDQLVFCSSSEGRQYLRFDNFKDDQSPLKWQLSSWVKLYAQYLDERLVCSRVLKCHFDIYWRSEKIRNRVPYILTEQLLDSLVALQNLIDDLCLCQVGPDIGDNSVIQGALVLIVADSYKLQEEIDCRVHELLDRVANLDISEGHQLLQICKRAGYQILNLQSFLERSKELRLLADLPLLTKVWVSESDMKKLYESIKTPDAPLYTKRSVSSGGWVMGEGGILVDRTAAGFVNTNGQDIQQRATVSTSQPRALTELRGAHTPRVEVNLLDNQSLAVSSCPDLIDLSSDTTLPGEAPEISGTPQQDLIVWSQYLPLQAVSSPDWENILLKSISDLSVGASQTSTNSFSSVEPRVDEYMYIKTAR